MAKKIYSVEETQKKFEALPQGVKDLLYSFEMTSIITKVGEKHGLHIDQMDTLNTEAAQVMLGLVETSEFPEILMEDLGVDEPKAHAIAKDVDEMLFTRVRAALNQPSVATLAPAIPAVSASAPPPPAPSPSVPVVPKVDMHPADLMLTQRTVAAPPTTPAATPTPTSPATASPAEQKAEPPKPQDYKADPYREPTN